MAEAASKPVATFSLVARDPDSGDLGVAVASKFLAVGAVVPFARAGVGAVATQAYVNLTYGPRALEILAAGGDPAACLAEFRATDAGIARRQVGIVAADGASATHTGDGCHDWAGGEAGDGYAAQGNILAGPEVVPAMVASFRSGGDLPFPERLVAALMVGDRSGGDRRGRESAALLVVGAGKGYGGQSDRWIDLRVDDHPDPVPELQRLLDLHRLFLDRPSGERRSLDAADIAWLQTGACRAGSTGAGMMRPGGVWSSSTASRISRSAGSATVLGSIPSPGATWSVSSVATGRYRAAKRPPPPVAAPARWAPALRSAPRSAGR
jgi:uncharacterized Ntn-hydrolase superfamily protein